MLHVNPCIDEGARHVEGSTTFAGPNEGFIKGSAGSVEGFNNYWTRPTCRTMAMERRRFRNAATCWNRRSAPAKRDWLLLSQVAFLSIASTPSGQQTRALAFSRAVREENTMLKNHALTFLAAGAVSLGGCGDIPDPGDLDYAGYPPASLRARTRSSVAGTLCTTVIHGSLRCGMR